MKIAALSVHQSQPAGAPVTSRKQIARRQSDRSRNLARRALPHDLSTIVGSGTALVGSFQQGARIMRRGGPTVEVTNSGYVGGADLFTTNQVAVRSESRLALCVFRPGAFTEIRGLT